MYDEVYVSDVRAFDYADSFDAIIAIESIHGIIDLELLRRLEGLVKEGGIIILALPSLPESIRVDELWEILGAFIKTLHPILRLTRFLRRGYLIAHKVV